MYPKRAWAAPGNVGPHVIVDKIGFQAIAVTAAIDQTGSVRALHTCMKSVNVDRFLQFLEQVYAFTLDEETYLFLDNLSVHHSFKIQKYCDEHNLKLIFNSAYSSEFNPIERLWAFSKRIFRKLFLDK